MNRLLSCALSLFFSVAVAADEVPFVVTPDNVTVAMLQLGKVGPEDYVIDLGSGDGRIVITAAKRYGARGLGIEIVSDLVEKSREAARLAGVSGRVSFREQDLFKTDLSPASVVTLYLLPDVNLQLRPRILQLRPGTRVVSHDWDMGDWEPDRTIVVDAPDKPVGLEKTSKVHLWIVPARVEGRWCGIGKARGKSIAIVQRYQHVRIEMPEGESVRALDGRLTGNSIRTRSGLTLAFDGQRLRATHAGGASAVPRGASFARSKGQDCKYPAS